MIARFLLTASALVLAVPACMAQVAPPADQQRPLEDGRLMPPERVADHVWVMRQPDRLWAAVIGNVTIVEQSDGVVLIDSGGSPADGRDVVEAVARLTPKPIKAIAVTHWHNDHPLGVSAILERFPKARVISTAKTAALMADPAVLNVGVGAPDAERRARYLETAAGRIQEFQKLANDPAIDAASRAQYAAEAKWIAERAKRQEGNHVVLPTETFTDKLLLDDPVAPVQLLYLGRANTKGDAVAWLPLQRTMVAGDVVVSPTPYGFVLPIAPWLATLDRLEAYPFRTLVPGHGPVQRDRSYLATFRWSMNDIDRQARALARSELTPEQAKLKFDASEHQRRFAVSGAWQKRWLDAYWLSGMFDTAFREARGLPIEARPDSGSD